LFVNTLDGGVLKEYWVENQKEGKIICTITIPGETSNHVHTSKLLIYYK